MAFTNGARSLACPLRSRAWQLQRGPVPGFRARLTPPIRAALRSLTPIPVDGTFSRAGHGQAARKLLAIPGPIEVADDVLAVNGSPPVSHVSPGFAKTFQNTLSMFKQLLFTRDGQPFITAGSGTLGWDMVAANLVEQGEEVLVLHSGYFGDSFADCFQAYGAKVTQLKADVGTAVSPERLKEAIGGKRYKLVSITHVDTSTGVLADAEALAAAVHEASPDALVVLDAVCSVGSEEIRMDDWGIDVVLSASQKGLGAPPGLCTVMASQKAIKAFEARKVPVPAYYVSWKRWLPIMQAYQSGTAAYFATPPTNLIAALEASLRAITTQPPSLAERFEAHKAASRKIREAARSMGMNTLALSENECANGMTALLTPEGLKPTDIIPRMLARDVIVAAGLHKDVKDRYFRIGHMGITAVNTERGDLDKIITALRESLVEAGYKP